MREDSVWHLPSPDNPGLLAASMALLCVLVGGILAMTARQSAHGLALASLALGLVFVGVIWLPRPRQPQAKLYQPRDWATRVLKWISAPQIEASILLWFGIALLSQPHLSSVQTMTGSLLLTTLTGWVFLVLAWRLALILPTPLVYSLITGFRLLYTVLVVVDIGLNNGPLIILGAYLGGILHGLLAMMVQWTLREMALHIRTLQQQVQQLQQRI